MLIKVFCDHVDNRISSFVVTYMSEDRKSTSSFHLSTEEAKQLLTQLQEALDE